MASRYHCLPSEVLLKGDSLDIYVMDSALTYRRYMEEEELHKQGKGPKPAPNLSQDKLLEILNKLKSKNEIKN